MQQRRHEVKAVTMERPRADAAPPPTSYLAWFWKEKPPVVGGTNMLEAIAGGVGWGVGDLGDTLDVERVGWVEQAGASGCSCRHRS